MMPQVVPYQWVNRMRLNLYVMWNLVSSCLGSIHHKRKWP